MKVFISVDIEGVTGSTVWDEVRRDHPDYPEFQRQMTREAAAACEGAMDAGAGEILVRDAHSTARNLIAEGLPEPAVLVRGWSRHPYMMMQELSSSFDAAVMVGYHSLASSPHNPLSHTMKSATIAWMTINGNLVSEFLLNAYTAAMEGVPVVFVSGDQGICDHAGEIIPGIATVAVKQGKGASTINIHPALACRQIRETVAKSLAALPSARALELPEYFEVEVGFKDFKEAYRASFYPGATLLGPDRIGFQTESYMDVLRLVMFV